MEDLFAKIFFAHCLGDYFLQPKTMALRKSEKNLQGIIYCTIHCVIYTACFSLFFQTMDPVFLLIIFISHWVIDYWSWGQKWLNLMRGRNFIEAFNSKEKYREIDITFSCIVYAVVDNTMHLFIAWLIIKKLF